MTPLEEIAISFGGLLVMFGLVSILVYYDEIKKTLTEMLIKKNTFQIKKIQIKKIQIKKIQIKKIQT